MSPASERTPTPTPPPTVLNNGATREPACDETSTETEKATKRARTTEGMRTARMEKEPTREHDSTPTDDDSVMNPRDIRALPKRALLALPKEEYQWPDPLLPPSDTQDDPHAKRTRDQDPAPLLPKSRVAFTDAIYDRVFIPLDTLVEKLRVEQREGVLSAPQDYLAIVPFGAGSAFFRDNPYVQKSVLAFLKTFRYSDTEAVEREDQTLQAIINEGTPEQVEAALLAQDDRNPDTKNLQVILPAAATKASTSKDKFGLPWALWLAGCPPRLREALLHQGTFSVSEKLTFTVLELTPNVFSWVLANFKGDAVTRANANAILSTIKRSLWLNNSFRSYVHRIFTRQGVKGDINDHAVRATNSFTLTFFDNTDDFGQPATVAQLRGRPVGDTKAERREYANIIRLDHYWVGLMPLILAGAIACQLCKAETHPSYDCPFPKTEGWFGPANNGAEKHATKVQKTLAKGKKREGEGGRNGAKRGGAPLRKGRK